MGYEIFEKLCEERSVRPIDVSRATAVSTSTLSAWKQGLYTPKQATMKKIADYFEVTVEFLETGRAETGYYMNPEAAEVAQEMFDTPGMRVLFDAARDSKPEDLKMAADLLKRLKETNRDG